MVRVCSVVVGLVFALALSASAGAQSASMSLPPVTAKTAPAQPDAELGPVVLADGTAVLGLLVKPGTMSYEKIDPGSAALRGLRTEPVADPAGNGGTTLALQAAGTRYVVAREDFATCTPSAQNALRCSGAPTSVDVTLYGVHGEAPIPLARCAGQACARCFASTASGPAPRLWTAASAEEVLIDPVCDDGTTPGPGVVDLSSGTVVRFSFPATRYGRAQGGPYQVAGDYLATPDGVLNYRTGAYQILGRGTRWQDFQDGVWGFGLLADGRTVYGFNSNVGHTIVAAGKLYESTPGKDDQPLPVAAPGYVDVVHGETIVMHGGSPVTIPRSPTEIVHVDGTVVGNLNVDSHFSGFNGRLAAGLEPGCGHDYLLLWDLAAGPPATVPAHCALPAVGPIRITSRTAAVRVACPARGDRDCATTATFPTGYSDSRKRTFRLRRGEHWWYTVLRRLTTKACHSLASRRRVRVTVTTADVVSGRRDIRVATRRQCP